LFSYAGHLPHPDEEKMNKLYETYKTLEPGSAKADWLIADFYAFKIEPDDTKAGTHYEKALQGDPLNKELLLSAGKFYQSKEPPDYERSFKYLNEVLQQDADDAYANLYLGWGNFIAGNYSEAKKCFEQCRGKNVDEHMVYQNLAHIALIEKDTATAKALYKRSYMLFTDKDAFYTAGLDDWKYIRRSGVSKDALMQMLEDAALP
jgi:Tfp pilus assembly protein PilF